MSPSPGSMRLVATVRGFVQGVGFRWFVERQAASLGLDGWVSNQSDGSVEVVAEGSEDVLGQLVLMLWEGPAGSAVSDVAVRHEPARGNLVGFAIRSGAHRGD
ncbi:MAG: acylphosphatase [Chloroflexota bacterium]|nr:acylphosphatase [Chloroflexota bacterium]